MFLKIQSDDKNSNECRKQTNKNLLEDPQKKKLYDKWYQSKRQFLLALPENNIFSYLQNLLNKSNSNIWPILYSIRELIYDLEFFDKPQSFKDQYILFLEKIEPKLKGYPHLNKPCRAVLYLLTSAEKYCDAASPLAYEIATSMTPIGKEDVIAEPDAILEAETEKTELMTEMDEYCEQDDDIEMDEDIQW